MPDGPIVAKRTLPLLIVADLPPMHFVLLHFVLSFTRPVRLPMFIGPHLRTILGDRLGDFFCRFPEKRKKNEGCPDDCHCEFTTLFRGKLQGFSSPPFIIKTRHLIPRDPVRQLHFDLVLLGPAIANAAQFCRAFQKGYLHHPRHTFRLHTVHADNPDGYCRYYDGEKSEVVGCVHENQWDMSHLTVHNHPLPTTLSLQLLTPTRIKLRKHYLDRMISCKNMLRALLNRYRSLITMELVYRERLTKAMETRYARHNSKLLDYFDTLPNIVEETKLQWQQNQHYSARQKQCLSTGGLTGLLTFHGALSSFLPLFQWGELFHVGEKANYGMGEFRLLS